MTAKEYLRKLQWAEIVTESRREELRRLDEEYTYLSGISYDRDRVQTSPSGDAFPQSDKRIDVALKVRQSIAQLQEFRAKVIEQISGMDNPTHTQVLTWRYIFSRSFNDIAGIMGYSYARVTHLHGEALQAFEKKYHEQMKVDKF